MKASKWITALIALLTLFAYSGGNDNPAQEESLHTEDDGHNHSIELEGGQTVNLKDIRNERGELTDEEGNIITGCPMHKDMIGSVGDLCSKCNYMEMVPITWSMEGIEAVQVTTLPDYNPPGSK